MFQGWRDALALRLGGFDYLCFHKSLKAVRLRSVQKGEVMTLQDTPNVRTLAFGNERLIMGVRQLSVVLCQVVTLVPLGKHWGFESLRSHMAVMP